MKLTHTQIDDAAVIWNSGKGTLNIARFLKVPEPLVYSNIDKIKELASFKRRASLPKRLVPFAGQDT